MSTREEKIILGWLAEFEEDVPARDIEPEHVRDLVTRLSQKPKVPPKKDEGYFEDMAHAMMSLHDTAKTQLLQGKDREAVINNIAGGLHNAYELGLEDAAEGVVAPKNEPAYMHDKDKCPEGFRGCQGCR